MSFIPGADGNKSVFGDGIQVDHLSENTSGHGVSIAGRTSGVTVESGLVGEELKQTRVRSAGISLAASGTVYNITTSALTLTAGIWDIISAVGISDNTTTLTAFDAAISTTNATLPGNDTLAVADASGQIRMRLEVDVATGGDYTFSLPPTRASLASSTTFYLVIRAIYTGSAPTGYGSIRAIRIA